MDWPHWITFIVTMGLVVYLATALLYPEKFS